MVSPTTENRKCPGSIIPACTGPTAGAPSSIRLVCPTSAAAMTRTRASPAAVAQPTAASRWRWPAQVAGQLKQPAGDHADQNQSHVLRGRVPQQPFQIGADRGLQNPVQRRGDPHCQNQQHHHSVPPPNKSKPTRMIPYTPIVTIAADINAET